MMAEERRQTNQIIRELRQRNHDLELAAAARGPTDTEDDDENDADAEDGDESAEGEQEEFREGFSSQPTTPTTPRFCVPNTAPPILHKKPGTPGDQ